VARLASACEVSKQKETYNEPTSGTPVCSYVKTEHKRGNEAGTLGWHRPEVELWVETVILSDEIAANSVVNS
jgi:hypothetical protein